MLRLASILTVSILAGSGVQAETLKNAANSIWQPYDGARIEFDVLRKGKPFGKHIVSFAQRTPGELVVTTDVDLKVKVGPFTAFKYELDSKETWRNGQLVLLEGKTNDDGNESFVRATMNDDALKVEGSAYSGDIVAPIIPSSHWNIEQVFSERMLSTESGEVLDMKIQPMGRESVKIGNDNVLANRYLLDSEIDIDLWYDDAGRWLKLTFEARGQTIEYRLASLY